MNDKDKDMEYNYGNDVDEEEIISKKKKYTKGFYVVFALCLCAIGIAGFYTYSDVTNYMEEVKSPSIITSSEPKNEQAEAKVDGVEKTTQDTQKEEATSAEKEEPVPTESATEPQQETVKVCPVGDNKEIVQEYSGDKLVYFETLKDWRVHKGTDYAVEKGGEIYSMSAGTVTSVFSDDLYGDCVELECENGFTTIYFGVQVNEGTASGTAFGAGDLIGTASGVPCEQNLKSHIHIEVKKDGRYVNPETYLNVDQNS